MLLVMLSVLVDVMWWRALLNKIHSPERAEYSKKGTFWYPQEGVEKAEKKADNDTDFSLDSGLSFFYLLFEWWYPCPCYRKVDELNKCCFSWRWWWRWWMGWWKQAKSLRFRNWLEHTDGEMTIVRVASTSNAGTDSYGEGQQSLGFFPVFLIGENGAMKMSDWGKLRSMKMSRD
jgi:hypothetical protein